MTMTKREFRQRETEKMGRFLGVEGLVGWFRAYVCDCGYVTTSTQEIYEHVHSPECTSKEAI